jgi:amidase
MPIAALCRFAILLCLLLAGTVQAQTASWLLATDRWGNAEYQALELQTDGAALRGTLGGDALQGSRKGRELRFSVTDASQAVYHFKGRLQGDALSGEADYPDPNNAQRRVTHRFTARRLPMRPAGGAKVYDFTPTDWSNEFSPHRKPVLTIWPGDGVRTTTLDSGGVDEHGVTRALFGNPQTGPFYVMGALPGDTLAVHIRRLRPNRDYADSLDSIVHRALGTAQAAAAAELGKPRRWILERERGVARPQQPGPGLAGFEAPLRPMLGGLAVAPGFGAPPASTGDTGRNGGNMDFNQIVEGSTVYLPVQQPGALLYLGDAHALQGDGETSQYALETSMDVEFSVEVLRGSAMRLPRVETPAQILVLGQAGSLDDALRQATGGLLQWLQQDYGLDMSEAAQVLGCCVQYRIANLAGRSVGLAAILDKSILSTLRKNP